MDEMREIKLNVKVDTYKALQNYLKNELKMNKSDMEQLVSKLVEATVEKQLSENGLLETRIDKAVNQSMARLKSTKNWQLEKAVDEIIEKKVGERILEVVKERMQDLKINISK